MFANICALGGGAAGIERTHMAKIEVTRKGESVPFSFDRGAESITGWACLVEVKKLPADTALVSRVITASSGAWTGFLTSAETSALAVGLYRLIAVLTNATTNEEEQVTLRFNVTEPWAS